MVYAIAMTNISIFKSDRSDLKLLIKGRTIRKLIGGGGGAAGEVQKEYSREGKLNEKKFLHAN